MGTMRASCEAFACVACGSNMERVDGVPVLQSLQGHVVHRCVACGHIVLVQEHLSADASAGWLTPLLMELKPGISCVAMGPASLAPSAKMASTAAPWVLTSIFSFPANCSIGVSARAVPASPP